MYIYIYIYIYIIKSYFISKREREREREREIQNRGVGHHEPEDDALHVGASEKTSTSKPIPVRGRKKVSPLKTSYVVLTK